MLESRGPLASGVLAIVNVSVIPMSSDTILPAMTVLARDGRIVSAASARETRVPAGATVVDGEGKFLIPGLADMHTHLFSDAAEVNDSAAPAEIGVMLANGVTAARLMIGRPQHLVLRRDVTAGRIPGPMLWLAGPQITGREDENAFLVTTPEEARTAVRQIVENGYDFVKLTNYISRPVYDAVVDEAKLRSIRVVGHVDPRVGVPRALEAGEQIEHLDGYFEAVLADTSPVKTSVTQMDVFDLPNWKSLDFVDDQKIAQIAGATARARVVVGPTQNVFNSAFARGESDSAIRNRPDWKFWPARLREGYLGARARYWMPAAAELKTDARRARYVEVRDKLVKAIHDSGGTIMAGSDTPEWFNTYGWGLHRELQALVAAGLTPYEALVAATRTPAAFVNAADDWGTVGKGKRADLVLLGGNPLADIRNTMRIEGVAFGGRWLNRALLDSMIERGATAIAGGKAATSGEISEQDIRTRVAAIADDSMQGRNTGRTGGLRAAKYIARELQRLGLQPAGDSGTYFQAIPWMKRSPDTTARIRIGSEAPLSWGHDFFIMPRIGAALALGGQPFGAGFDAENVPTVYGGRLGDSTIAPGDARGKIVVFRAPANQASFAFWQRDNLRRYADAAAIVVGTLDLGVPPALRGPRETYWDTTRTAGVPPMTVIAVRDGIVDRIFPSGNGGPSVGTSGVPISGRARFLSEPTESPAYNVVGILRGSNARFRGSYVAIGAHYDHVGIGAPQDHDSVRAFNAVMRPRGANDPASRTVSTAEWTRIRAAIDSVRKLRKPRLDSIYNGADDDGSGTVLALEIAEAFADTPARPRRSLLFVFHTAEEKGLFGSQYYTDHPTVPRDSIVAQLNMDQMGRGESVDNPHGGANALVVIGSRRLSQELGDLTERVNARPEYSFTIDYGFDRDGDPMNAYCRSDHYMYARYGIPIAFFSAAAWHVDYHMVTDEAQYVSPGRMTRIGRFIRDVAGEVGNLERRLTMTRPKPDPNGVCSQ